MNTTPRDVDRASLTNHPWLTGWLLTLPFAMWLLLDKTAKFSMTALDPTMLGMPRNLGAIAFLKWMAHYAWVRFGIALLVAWVAQRILFPRRRAALPILLLLFWIGMVAAVTLMTPGSSFVQILATWSINASQQAVLYAVCVWREVATIGLVAMIFGLLFRCCPDFLQRELRCVVMGVVIALCMLAGVDFAYEAATGQAPSASVLLFSAFSWKDMLPLVGSEATPARVIAILGGAVLSVAWFWWLGKQAPRASTRTSRHDRAALIAAMIGSLALLTPTISTGVVPLERHAEGTLVAFVKTAASKEGHEAVLRVHEEFEATGRPRWHSADMSLQATESTRAFNVVVVMLESVRAVSTSLHTSGLQTTPFLHQLAQEGMVVEDMSVVYPRTNGAWMAILGGQYPLTIEGVTRWTVENQRHRRIRSLPSLLRQQGYATAFFTPTDLNFLDEIAVVRALDFEHVVSEPELKFAGSERTNYLGQADETMVEPILAWTAAQQRAGRPFMTAIMTNVGHHPYKAPETWKKVQFPGVTDERLNDYYNCLLYIDSFLQTLMRGYDQLGLRDNTVFVILGDHGQFFGEHGIRQVFNGLYEEGVHVPALVYAPGHPAVKGTVQGARQHIDVMPTVLDLLGYETRSGKLPGISMMSPPDPQRSLFYSTSIQGSSLAARRGSRKYIYHFDRAPMEVFDLANDPRETQPIEVPDHELVSIKREMLEWKAASELSMFARSASAPRSAGEAWVSR